MIQLRAYTVLPVGTWPESQAYDTIALTYDERHRRRYAYIAQGGTAFLLDLPRATVLQQGDGLALEDGRIIAVTAAPEQLSKVTPTAKASLVQLAWHIGNRHLPAQLSPEAIYIREDHVITHMLEGLGAQVSQVSAPFSPESGAYAGGHSHSHSHDHAHDHDHDHKTERSHEDTAAQADALKASHLQAPHLPGHANDR